jgi:multiple sugar transport system permease protein
MAIMKMNKKAKKEARAAVLFLLPMAAGLGIFTYYAFFRNIYNSFTHTQNLQPSVWVGLRNYRDLMFDPSFWGALKNTVWYVVGCVPPMIIISLFLAVLLNNRIKMIGLFRTLIFFPLVTTPAAIAMTWRWLLNTRYGLVNVTMKSLNLEPIPWLTSAEWTQLSCIVVIVWATVSYQVVVFLAGLQSIHRVYYEAAMIDGANRIRQFFHVTLPLLSPTLYFVITVLVIGLFKEFEIVFMLIPAGEYNVITPAIEASRSLVRYFYDTAFRNLYLEGYAAAISVLLFIIILIVTIVQNILQKKWVFYEN